MDHQIIPLLSAPPPCFIEDPDSAANRCRISSGINLWQNQAPHQAPSWVPQSSSPLSKTSLPVLDSMVTCQDCGNKAKKDCSFRRCRTCCKSRGFDCSTHVRSTWVSAAQRRERQISSGGEPGSSLSTSSTKKPRLLSSNEHGTAAATHTTSTSNTTTPPRSFETSSSQQEGSFRDGWPGQITAPAVFKCVRVTNMEDGEDEYAYQAMVKISGHVFKGFLYDQGSADDVAEDGGGGIPNISELHLGGYGRGGGGADIYAGGGSGGGGGLIGGTSTYGKPMN